MDNSTFSLALTGVVPAACDAEAGEVSRLSTDVPLSEFAVDGGLADQSQRFLRWIAGESSEAWRRTCIAVSRE